MAKKKTSSRGSSKRNGDKAGAIRAEFETRGWKARTKDVVSALAARGIIVSAAHVSNIRTAANKKAGKSNTVRRGRPVALSVSSGSLVDGLKETKKFVDRVGGISCAKELLDLLAAIQS